MNEYSERIEIDRYPLWKDKAPLLTALDIELTERCNNNCIHCCINLPADDKAARERELSAKELANILDEAAQLGCLQVRFTGGEPLLREDFCELYLHARRLGMKVLLFTNARLITTHLADLFQRIPPRAPIEISVYGMSASSYEKVSRAPGSFADMQCGIELLLSRKIPFFIKGALLPPNKDELNEFDAWAKTIPWMDKPPAYAMFFDLRNRRDDAEKNRQIEALRISPEEGLKVQTRGGSQYKLELAEFCGKFMGSAGNLLFSCGCGEGGCVDAYGRFQPCLSLRAPELSYDLRRGSLRDALENVFPRLKTMRAVNAEYLARCAQCNLRGLCEQCPAKSWAENGTLDTPVEYFCNIAHAQARYVGLFKEDRPSE